MKIKELVSTKYKLENLAIFRGLSKEKILEIINYSDFKIKKFEKQETLSFRGDKINDIMIVLDGELRGEMQKFNGDTIIIDFLKQNDMIAPAFIFGINNEFPVDLIANTNSTILSLNKSSLIALLSENELLLTNFLNEVSNKSQLLSKRIWFNFVNKSIEDKIIDYIEQNSKDNIIHFRPSISEISRRFGVTRPSLSREISNLCSRGVLQRIGKNKYNINRREFEKI